MTPDPARSAVAAQIPAGAATPDRRAQQAASIAAALVVAAGVVWFDWSAFLVLALYWIENVVIGIANVIRLLAVGLGGGLVTAAETAAVESAARSDASPEDARKALAGSRVAGIAGTLFLVPFFCVHYGMFCLVHGVFVVALFSGDPNAKNVFFDAPFYMLGRVLSESWGWVALLAIVASVVVDTARWFARRRDDMLATAKAVMHEPYGRIIVLHVVLLAGGFLMQITKAPQSAVLLLTAFKLIYELRRAR